MVRQFPEYKRQAFAPNSLHITLEGGLQRPVCDPLLHASRSIDFLNFAPWTNWYLHLCGYQAQCQKTKIFSARTETYLCVCANWLKYLPRACSRAPLFPPPPHNPISAMLINPIARKLFQPYLFHNRISNSFTVIQGKTGALTHVPSNVNTGLNGAQSRVAWISTGVGKFARVPCTSVHRTASLVHDARWKYLLLLAVSQ